FLNPAFFDGQRNQVICLYELPRLSEELCRAYQQNKQQLERIKEQEAELSKVYKGKIPAALRAQIEEKRSKIDLANKKNERDFEASVDRLFQPLYHEAFHAYLANFVYPAKEGSLPCWLNEGLAQIFDSALLEAGELRVGHADAKRLEQVKTLLKKGDLV